MHSHVVHTGAKNLTLKCSLISLFQMCCHSSASNSFFNAQQVYNNCVALQLATPPLPKYVLQGEYIIRLIERRHKVAVMKRSRSIV